MQKNIITKIKKAGLVGRGGGCYPVDLKWGFVKKALGEVKYVICNAAEGEPGVKKDLYILENYPEQVIDGMRIALEYLGAGTGRSKKRIEVFGYIYLNPNYCRNKKLIKKLKKAIGELPVKIIKKPKDAGYIGGEETAVINGIEGRRIEPRLRPPFPPTHGLWERPTLINNVETFYNVSLVASGEYKNERFYTINGDCLWTGVYRYADDWSIEKILKTTENYPNFDFFVQSGGDAAGVILNPKQLSVPVGGCGTITVYSIIKYDPLELIRGWLNFFRRESCGKCTPCREGTYRLREVLNEKDINWKVFAELLRNLSETSFCGLGCAGPIAVTAFMENVVSQSIGRNIRLNKADRKIICECFQ